MEKNEYTIKIIPSDDSPAKNIKLSSGLFKYGIASVVAGAVIMVGAFGYAAYSAYFSDSQTQQIEELQKVNSIQQEQILQLSKKANNLQDQLGELEQVEMELRHISGVVDTSADGKPAVSDSAEPKHDGQGGPLIEPSIGILRNVLDDLETRVVAKKASLEQLKYAMRDQMQLTAFSVSSGVNSGIPSIWPTTGDVSSPYGLRWGGTDFHPGIDIANDIGTPIVATADGVVTMSGWNSGGYGNMVDVDHGNGYSTLYAHAQQVVVSPGQRVHRGQVLAYMGSTGFSTGPHLHYEVSINGQRVNPISFLR